MAKIRRIEPILPIIKTRKKVAAYARVSMETELLHHSLSAQVSHYSSLIQSNPEWEYAGVYADEGITGTSTKKRDEFNRLMKDCDAGKIDLVLVKSISRFARDTVDTLKATRHLKDLGIDVYFERPVDTGFDYLQISLPDLDTASFYGYSEAEIEDLKDFAADNAALIWEMAREGEDHLANAV